MKAGQTNIEVGSKAKIKGFTGNDAIYNGLIGEVTHPFATGCTDKGWIGLRLEQYTVYGYNINAHESEIEVVTDTDEFKHTRRLFENYPDQDS